MESRSIHEASVGSSRTAHAAVRLLATVAVHLATGLSCRSWSTSVKSQPPRRIVCAAACWGGPNRDRVSMTTHHTLRSSTAASSLRSSRTCRGRARMTRPHRLATSGQWPSTQHGNGTGTDGGCWPPSQTVPASLANVSCGQMLGSPRCRSMSHAAPSCLTHRPTSTRSPAYETAGFCSSLTTINPRPRRCRCRSSGLPITRAARLVCRCPCTAPHPGQPNSARPYRSIPVCLGMLA
jgi:hypothetical protein